MNNQLLPAFAAIEHRFPFGLEIGAGYTFLPGAFYGRVAYEYRKSTLFIRPELKSAARRLRSGIKKSLNFFGWAPKFLPPYSPDFNPIERIWNTMKARWFNNYVCRDVQQLIDRLAPHAAFGGDFS